MNRKKDTASSSERKTTLRRERPRWEIDLITERVREKIAEENKMRDFRRLVEEYCKLVERNEELQRSQTFWQSVAMSFLATLLGIIVGMLGK